MAYQRPMVTVDQNMTVTPTSIERDQPAFIFGPNYQLYRYDNAEEKAKTYIGTYDGSELSRDYPSTIRADKVDKSYTKLFGDNVVVNLADLADKAADVELPEDSAAMRAAKGGYAKLMFKGKKFVDIDENGDAIERDEILSENLAVGDKLLVTYEFYKESENLVVEGTLSTTVSDVSYKSVAVDLDASDSYPNTFGPGTLVTIDDAIPDSYTTVSVKSVKLVDVMNGVEFSRKTSTAPNYNWEDSSDGKGVKVNAGLETSFDGKTVKVVSADLYVTYRELLTEYADNIRSVAGAANVEEMLGAISPDNPLAMGVYMAALNAATDDGDKTPPVYFMATPTDDQAGYADVLQKASLTDKVYVLAPTTRDEAVLELVRSHVLEMSSKTSKMWRIAAASADIAESKAVLTSAHNVNGGIFRAIPLSESSGDTKGAMADAYAFRIVKSATDRSANADTELKSTVVENDIVRFNYHKDGFGEEIYDTYIVKKVVNNSTFTVTKAITTDGMLTTAEGLVAPSRIEIYHPYSMSELADVIASTSKAMASRRMLNVFPTVFVTDGVQMTGEFAACAVAGLISATEPQQPITNVSVRGIDSIPLVYQQYSKSELDTMAEGGTFIVAQDLPEDEVYVRHQITTAYPDGNLNTAELSITKNVDSISYAFADVFRPYYGKYNITSALLVKFRAIAQSLINQFGSSSSVYGPQLVTEETVINYIRQNELMKDHVDISISLSVPYPCNNIDIVLTV